jgi:hypothetical protein
METTGRFFGGPFLLLSIELEQEASPMAVSKRARLAAKTKEPRESPDANVHVGKWGEGSGEIVGVSIRQRGIV